MVDDMAEKKKKGKITDIDQFWYGRKEGRNTSTRLLIYRTFHEKSILVFYGKLSTYISKALS